MRTQLRHAGAIIIHCNLNSLVPLTLKVPKEILNDSWSEDFCISVKPFEFATQKDEKERKKTFCTSTKGKRVKVDQLISLLLDLLLLLDFLILLLD